MDRVSWCTCLTLAKAQSPQRIFLFFKSLRTLRLCERYQQSAAHPEKIYSLAEAQGTQRLNKNM
jgi:hypothetical protein